MYFYSAADRGPSFAYTGERRSPGDRDLGAGGATESLLSPEFVWVGWIARKLWVTIPWNYDGPTEDSSSVLVLDPTVGEGAWIYFNTSWKRSSALVFGSDVESQPNFLESCGRRRPPAS